MRPPLDHFRGRLKSRVLEGAHVWAPLSGVVLASPCTRARPLAGGSREQVGGWYASVHSCWNVLKRLFSAPSLPLRSSDFDKPASLSRHSRPPPPSATPAHSVGTFDAREGSHRHEETQGATAQLRSPCFPILATLHVFGALQSREHDAPPPPPLTASRTVPSTRPSS